MSDSLRLLRGNEQMSDSLKKCCLKKSKILFNYVVFKVLKKKIQKKWANRSFPLFWWAICSFHSNWMSDVSESLISLKSNERCEWIAQFAHQKWSTMSDSLRLFIFLSESLIHSFFDKKRAIRSEIKWANSQPWEKWGLIPEQMSSSVRRPRISSTIEK